jgi:hypothetical protein
MSVFCSLVHQISVKQNGIEKVIERNNGSRGNMFNKEVHFWLIEKPCSQGRVQGGEVLANEIILLFLFINEFGSFETSFYNFR